MECVFPFDFFAGVTRCPTVALSGRLPPDCSISPSPFLLCVARWLVGGVPRAGTGKGLGFAGRPWPTSPPQGVRVTVCGGSASVGGQPASVSFRRYWRAALDENGAVGRRAAANMAEELRPFPRPCSLERRRARSRRPPTNARIHKGEMRLQANAQCVLCVFCRGVGCTWMSLDWL